jgi:hypothetical protein
MGPNRITLMIAIGAVAAGTASTLEVGAGRFDPREATRLAGGVEIAELEPVPSG